MKYAHKTETNKVTEIF